MPTYTYHCDNCGIRFDRYQKFEDQALSYCPECNKKSLRKVYAPVGIVFKGSGSMPRIIVLHPELHPHPVEKTDKMRKQRHHRKKQ